MKLIRLVGLVSSVLIGQMPSVIYAAEVFSAAESPVSKDDDALFQDIPSVYDASKYDQKVTKAPPGSTSVVTADEIKKWGYRTFGDVLNSLKGFYNTNDRNYGYAGARGFGLPSDYNSRLLLMIDGHRINNNIFDSFDTSEGFPVDLNVIDRIEVIRGPSSSLYGTNAFFGVINIITKRGRDQQGANVNASYGSNNAYKTNVSYGDRFKNGLETFISGTFYNSDGFKNLYYNEFDSPTTNNGWSVGNDAEQSRKLIAKAAFGDFSIEGVFSKRYKDIPTASFGTVFNSHELRTADETTFVEFKYDHTFENQLNLKSKLSYNHIRYAGIYPANYGTPDLPNVVLNQDMANGEWWRADLEANKVIFEDHRISMGGQFQDNFHQNQTNYDLETYLDVKAKTYQWGIFLQDDYEITKSLSLNAGVRYDYFSTYGDTLNPRAGLTYKPWESSAIKLLYGTAFRAPNQFELNYTSSNIRHSQDLKPERLQTLELILEHNFTSQLRAEFNLFKTDINDIILSKSVGDGFTQYQNAANVDSHGVEVQLENNWLNGWQGRISYSWQQTKDKATHQVLNNSPEHMVKFNLIAPLWADKVFLGFETQYMSGRRTRDDGDILHSHNIDDHVVSNLTVFTQKWIKGLELSGGVYNLFDQRYLDPTSAAFKQDGIPQDSLTFRVKASLDF
ncbi:MAG: TonB-dependent receptor [Methylococcaceae bacterium]|nr:TonB-dependent receptor [Methylococcaceae bacterium]